MVIYKRSDDKANYNDSDDDDNDGGDSIDGGEW